MKNYFFALLMVVSTLSFAQESFWGVKAGLNYNQNGDLKITDITNAANNVVTGSDGKVGYHIGVFGKLDLTKLYLRPELVYTKTKSDYGSASYDVSKLDIPVLLGYELIGPLSVFAGPAFQYTLNNDLEGTNIDDVEKDFTVGLNIGAGVQLGNLGLDVRYERGFSENEANFINSEIANVEGRVDSRPSQVIFSLSFKL